MTRAGKPDPATLGSRPDPTAGGVVCARRWPALTAVAVHTEALGVVSSTWEWIRRLLSVVRLILDMSSRRWGHGRTIS